MACIDTATMNLPFWAKFLDNQWKLRERAASSIIRAYKAKLREQYDSGNPITSPTEADCSFDVCTSRKRKREDTNGQEGIIVSC